MTAVSPQAQAIADALNANAAAIVKNTAVAQAAEKAATAAIAAGQQAATDLAAIMGALTNLNEAVAAQTVTATPPPVVIAPETLPSGVIGAAYSQQLTAAGGTGTGFQFATSGQLPAGLALAADGMITGTPTVGGSTFTVTATDAVENVGSRTYTLAVSGA